MPQDDSAPTTPDYTELFSSFSSFSFTLLDEHVGQLTLNRPDVQNRFDTLLHSEFAEALTILRRSGELRALILASIGNVFSAGGDFDYILTQNEDYAERVRVNKEARALLEALIDLPMPVIAAVQGHSVGLGTTIAFACDAVVACRSVRFSDPHVGIGLVAGDGGCIVWPQAIGMLRARRYLLTGDAIKAPEAYTLGLVTDLVDDADEVLPVAQNLARKIAKLPPVAVQGTKKALNHITKLRAAEVLELSLAEELQSISTEDLVEAIDAFRAKREPRYHGR
jgi:enoyl-CoA hydratase